MSKLEVDPSAQRLGRTIKGKWTLEGVLGVGGMATVYRARHRNGARVAIKMLHATIGASEECRARFAQEARVSNRIGHPALVRVIDEDVDEAEGTPFLVMDLIEGRALDEVGIVPMDAAELLDVAAQILEALVAAHAHGVVHRDLKPANLVREASGRIRILDFGIARVIDDAESGQPLTRPGMSIGTPEFLAPEQALGRAVTPQTDLFALGATLFFLAAGSALFGEGTPQEIVVRVATETAPSLAEYTPAIDPRVIAIVDRATRTPLDERWGSAGEMLDAVRAALAEIGVARVQGAHADTVPAPPATTPAPIALDSAPPAAIVTTVRRPRVVVPLPRPIGSRLLVSLVAAAFVILAAFVMPSRPKGAPSARADIVEIPSASVVASHATPAPIPSAAPPPPAHFDAADLALSIARAYVAVSTHPHAATAPHPRERPPVHAEKHIDVGY